MYLVVKTIHRYSTPLALSGGLLGGKQLSTANVWRPEYRLQLEQGQCLMSQLRPHHCVVT